MEHRIANYMYSFGLVPRMANKHKFIIGIADAYNAFGLIGPEHNGIFILDDTDKAVVLDQHMPQTTGYFGPSARQIAEVSRLAKLSDAEFKRFCGNHPRRRP